MTEKVKQDILKAVSGALEYVEHGKITVEVRGANKSADVVVECRTRFETEGRNTPTKTGRKRVIHIDKNATP